MMRFKYIGSEDDVIIFGASFARGEAVHVEDPHAVAKLLKHPQFELIDAEREPVEQAVDELEAVTPRKRGRPRKNP